MGEGRGHGPKRLGVVGDGRPRADRRDQLLRAVGPAGQHLAGALEDAEPPALVGREQRSLRRFRRPDRHRHLLVRQPRHVPHRSLAHAGGERALGLRRRGRRVGRAERLLETPQRLAQLEAPEYVAEPRSVGVGRDELRELELERDVALGGRELLGEPRVLGVVDQVLLALGAADLIDVIEHLLERAEPLQQLGRGLVPDAGYAGDVVAGVALEADEVRDQLGGNAVAVDDAVAVVDARVGDAAAGRHDLDAVVDELVGVAVPGHDHHRDRRLGLPRRLHDRRDHVVGLVPLDRQVAVTERLDQRRQVGPLLPEKVGPARALRLVVGVDLLAAGVARVPDHDRRLRAVVGEDLHEHRGEPEDRVRRLAGRGRDRLREREERAVGKAVAVDQKELVCHVSLSVSRAGAR